ncbi:MAG TPA: hypothetical protein VFK03_02710 [Candidatus Saccharimonadales bacterium]|nr:hypothetical protein [Candidatus Saccharimonadales bacterium]
MANSGKTAAVAVVTLVIGLLVGFGVTKAMDGDNRSGHDMASMTQTSDKASDLRANLVTLGIEHMTYTNQAVDAALDGAPNAKQLADLLYANGDQIGAAVGSVYGQDAEKTFDQVWKLHLDQFVNYAVASSKGDKSAKQAALDKIDSGYTKPLAQFLAKANPNFDEQTLETALRDHVNMTAKMIDYHVAGDYQKETDELSMANKHMEGIMSTLAAGIVKQFPKKF